jgi:L-ascorbate metabolism protein UlaG (beta-lactamase superfamily)
MTQTHDVSILYQGSTFVELHFGDAVVFVDPAFRPSERRRRARDGREGARARCDYVFVTHLGDGIDDALDAVEGGEAVLVGPPQACRLALRELGLSRRRALDLEPFERARDEAFRVTALPSTAAALFDEGLGMLEGLGDAFGPRALGRVPSARRALDGAGRLFDLPRALGDELLRGLRGRPGLGYLFESTGGQRVAHLGGGVHRGLDERALDDVAELADPLDVALVDVAAAGVDDVVRAARRLAPSTLLLYRSADPYGGGRRSRPLPVAAFVEAVGEDLGDATEALHLRPGDRFVLEATRPAAAVGPSGETAPAPNAAPPRPAGDRVAG